MSARAQPFECRPPEYITPDGFVDESFTYVFDTSLFVNGGTYENLAVPIDPGEDFFLRRVEMGGPLAYAAFGQGNQQVGTFRIKDRMGRAISSAPLAPGLAYVAPFPGRTNTWSKAIVPEIAYPGGGQLRFDLYNINNRIKTGAVVPQVQQSQVLFHGALRRKVQPGVAPTPKPFRREWYRQVFYPAVTWPGYVAGPIRLNDTRRFQFPIDDYPFELYGVHVRNTFAYGAPALADGGSVPPLASATSTSDVALTVFDPYLRARSSGPILAEYMNTRLSLTEPLPQFNFAFDGPCAPYGFAYCPPILYPAGGVITVDIQSLCDANDLPCALEIVFLGVIRIPT